MKKTSKLISLLTLVIISLSISACNLVPQNVTKESINEQSSKIEASSLTPSSEYIAPSSVISLSSEPTSSLAPSSAPISSAQQSSSISSSESSQSSLPEEDADGFIYTLKDDGTYEVSGGAIKDHISRFDLIIPSTYKGIPVTSIPAFGFSDISTAKTVTIPENIQRIGRDAFAYCRILETVYWNAKDFICDGQNMFIGFQYSLRIKNVIFGEGVRNIPGNIFNQLDKLTNITFSSTITSIDDHAFSDCKSLVEVDIPDNVTTIGYNAFMSCESLKTVHIGNGVTYISDGAFYWNENLESVNIPNGLEHLGDYVFHHCLSLNYNISNNACYLGNESNPYLVLIKALDTSIETCVMEDSCRFIANVAFENCQSLTSFIVKDHVEHIGGYVFLNCYSLNSLFISKSVVEIGACILMNCYGISEITVDSENTHYCSIDGALYDASLKTLIRYPSNNPASSFVVPETVETIEQYAFENSVNLLTIVLPDGLKSIGTYAFLNCSSLASNTYEGATYLSSPTNNYFLLLRCQDTARCIINDTCKIIAPAAFENNLFISSIDIPASVKIICDSAFKQAEFLKTVVFHEGLEIIDTFAFANCTRLNNIVLPDSVTTYGNGAFYCCRSLTSVTLSSTMTELPDSFFDGCTSLRTIIVSGSIHTIHGWAFSNCEALTHLVIGKSVTQIDAYAFTMCMALKAVFYEGTQSEWASINIEEYENYIILATIYFYSENKPSEPGNYWHYVDGTPNAW